MNSAEKIPFLYVLDTAAALGITAQLLRLGDLFIPTRQKRAVQRAVEDITLRLSYLEPIIWWARLLERRANLMVVILTLATFTALYTRTLAPAVAIAAIGGLLAAIVWRIAPLREAYLTLLSWQIEPLLPLTKKHASHFKAALDEFNSRQIAVHLGAVGTLGASIWLFTSSVMAGFIAGLPLVFGCFVFLLVENAAFTLLLVLCATFAVELSLRALTAVCWRLVEFSGGAYAAVILTATVLLSLASILARMFGV